MKTENTRPPGLTEKQQLKLAVMRVRKIMGNPQIKSGPEFLSQMDLFKLGFSYLPASSINDTPVMTITLRNGVMINLQGLRPSRPREFWEAVEDAFAEFYTNPELPNL